ncbi:MAG: hypothetical protein RIT45_785 [Pseudomonadota bacterium]
MTWIVSKGALISSRLAMFTVSFLDPVGGGELVEAREERVERAHDLLRRAAVRVGGEADQVGEDDGHVLVRVGDQLLAVLHPRGDVRRQHVVEQQLGATPLDLGDVAPARAPQLHDAPALNALERTIAIATWLGRMRNEHASARVFEALTEQARAAGLDAATIATLHQFRGEELRHGELCAAAAVALGGQAQVDLGERAAVLWHDDVDPLEGLLRNVLSISCLSETVAVALIASERLETGPIALQETLRAILADEVGHARFGWALLDRLAPRIGAARAERLSAWLRLAFGHVEQHELRELAPGPSPSRAATDVGVCDGDEARRLFYETVETVIVPGLERRGLAAAWAWQRRVFPVAA